MANPCQPASKLSSPPDWTEDEGSLVEVGSRRAHLSYLWKASDQSFIS